MKSNKKFVILLEILVITFLVMSVVPVCGLSESSADVSAYPDIVNPGDEITVTYSAGFEFNRIVMYMVDDPNEEEYYMGYYFDWYNLASEKSGTLIFTAPDEPGDYEFRLFEDDGYTDIARSNIVRVQEGTTVPTLTPTISASPSIVNPGDEITVTYSGAPGFELDWISMYKVGDPNEEEYDWGCYLDSYFLVAGEKSGTLSFTAPDEPGYYEFRLFEDDGYTDIARSNIVRVQVGTTVPTLTPTISASPSIVNPGDEITVTYSGASGCELDWIAMYKVGDPNEEAYDWGCYLDGYLAGEKSGTLSFTAPDEPGDYEFRLFEDDGIARSNIVTVQEGTTVSTPTPTPTTPSDGGLVGYWNFNEGSGNIAYDSSGSGNDGTIHGATWVDNGSCEKALSLDGVDDYVKTNPATFQSNDITVEAWIYPKSFSSLGYGSENILCKGARGTNNFLFELLLYPKPDKIIAFRISNNGNNCDSIVGTTSLELNKWYHVVGVYRSSDKFFAVYVNGTEDNSKTSRLSSLYHDASKYRIAARYDYHHFGRDFNGIIDEVRIYDRALSEEEIQADMNECAPKSTLPDLSGKSDCEGAGGYWYNNQCNEEEEESGYGDLKVTYISREEVQEKYTVSYDETFKYDDDGDGANEATLYYKGENNLVMSSDDTDKDGKVDLIFHYDDEEFLTRAIRDTDGDGELDQILHFNREEEIIKVEKIRSDDTKNSSLFITLGGIIIFIVMCFWLYVTKKQPCNLRMNELNYIGRVNPQVGKRLFLISIAFLSILVLLVSPVSSLEDVIDDDCNIKEDVWDRDWKKYSDLENTPLTFEERPLTSRSTQTRQYYATQSEIVDAKLQIFFLRRDMEIDRLMRVELNEYKKELVDVHKKNLLKSFMRLSFLTAHVTVEAVIAGKSVGGSYNNIVAPPSHVSTVASSLKIWGALDTMAKDSETPSLEDKTQDATEVVMGAAQNVALDAVESLGDPKTVGTAFVTQTIGAIPIKYKGKEWMLTEEDFEILEEAHLELKGIDMAWADSFEANLERLDKVKELEAQIKELEKELAKREAKVKSMLKDSLVDNCKDGKKDKCDFEHLNLCKNEKDCDYIGRYWYGNQCNENPEEDTSAGDTSVGEFDCPIPKGAKHSVTSYSWGCYDYWKINGNYVGPFQSWSDTEKTKKHEFICYNAEGKKHGVCWKWYEDGTLNFELNYKDGKLQVYRRLDEDGTLRIEKNYKDDKLQLREWDEDGTLEYEKNYKDDKLHGVLRGWDEDGTLEYEWNYKDGKLHGVHRRWYEDGTLRIEKNYKDDKLHGVLREWDEDGTLEYEWNYKDGKKHGVCRKWWSGELTSENNYKDGKKHGVCKEWSVNGKLTRECNYEEGKCVSCVHGHC